MGRAAAVILVFGFGCNKPQKPNLGKDPKAPTEALGNTPSSNGTPAKLSSVQVDHGELDTQAPESAPKLAATTIATTVYKLADENSRRLGYIRLGGIVRRDPDAITGRGCEKGQWYRIYPMGYVCTKDATTDLESPLVRANQRRPHLDRPLPYSYGFVRAASPQYLRIPTKAEQLKSEFKLEEHLAWYAEHEHEVQQVELGANDVPLDARGIARPGLKPAPGFRNSTELTRNELFGGDKEGKIPFWLQGGRQVPNVSGYQVPEYAYFADRVSRKTGLSFVDAFDTESDGLKRSFAVTVDMRLIPTTKVKPDTGSPFHGIEIPKGLDMPFAWAIKRETKSYQLVRGRDEVRPAGEVPRRALIPLSGNARIQAGERYYQSLKDKLMWLKASDLGIVAPPPEWPEFAEKGEKWIDVSLGQQTLVLYEGKRATYATLVSTGRDRFGDPKETLSTPQGTFRLTSKHIAAAMDSEENSSVAGGTRSNTNVSKVDNSGVKERLLAAEKRGEPLDEEDRRRLANIKKGRDPEYGVTVRRGSAGFELRDVPWIQYFASGYALHGAYWHDVFGIPRSHGCVNLAPIDARYVFMWSDPPVPDGWHGVNIGADMGQGTGVYIHR
ncbi:MAG: L,D-transpeptidase [Polyangiaceae bacterium]|nr:L,D-transpeptidase [Polyangiaceae bacterium]